MRFVRYHSLTICAVVLLTTSAWAERLAYSPSWGNGINGSQPNQSFMDINYGRIENTSRPINDFIINASTAKGLREEFERMNNDYETKQNYDLATDQDHRDYFKRSSDFTQNVLRVIFSYQMTEGMQKVEKRSEEIRTFKRVKQQVQSVARAVTQGSVQASVAPQFTFGSKVNLPQEKGNVWMRSPIVNGDLDVRAGEGWSYDPVTMQKLTDKGIGERYSVAFSRNIPVFDMNSALTYGGTTTKMTTSVSKQITKNLSAEVASVRGIDPARAGLPEGGERYVKMYYGVSF